MSIQPQQRTHSPPRTHTSDAEPNAAEPAGKESVTPTVSGTQAGTDAPTRATTPTDITSTDEAATGASPTGGLAATPLTPAEPRLTGRRLPRWTPWAVTASALTLGWATRLAAGPQHTIACALLAAACHLTGVQLLSRAVEGRRKAADRLATTLVTTCLLLTLLPLVTVLSYTVAHGVAKLDGSFLTHSMNGVSATMDAGGVYHALLGTVEQVGLATAMSVPLGLLAAIYLVEYGHGPLARTLSYVVDVLTGIPSVVAGLFVLSFWLLALGQGYSGFAGSMALAILMTPVVVRSTEESLRLVPDGLREASLALGVPRWRTIVRIVLPTASSGIATGVLLAVARVAGETAPVLLLTFGNPAINANPFHGAQSSLPLYVFTEYGKGNDLATGRAWAAALLLIALIMLLNLTVRLLARVRAPKTH